MVAVMVTAVMGTDRHIRTRQRTPQVTAAAEDSPIFQAFRVNFPTSLVVLGMEEGKALEKRFRNLARMPLHTRPQSRRMAADRIGLSQSPARTHLLYTRRPTRHHMPQTSLSHLEEATNLLTTNLRDSLDLVVELEPANTVVLGAVRLGSPNHELRTTKRTRMMGAAALEPQGSPTLNKVTDSSETR